MSVKSIAPQLHIVLGSISAMLVAFIALVSGTSPGTCVIKATAAFLVFAGFGLVLRFVLGEALNEESDSDSPGIGSLSGSMGGSPHNLDVIVPGTSVADLLGANPGIDEMDDPALLNDGENPMAA